MSGVWVFKNGVARLVQNPRVEPLEQTREGGSSSNYVNEGSEREREREREMMMMVVMGGKRKGLVYLPTNKVVESYGELHGLLHSLGWRPYESNSCHHQDDEGGMIQLHKSHSSVHLLSLPRHPSRLRSMHFYDIVLNNRGLFKVLDLQ